MSKTTLKTPEIVYTADQFKQTLHLLYQSERLALAEGRYFERTPMLMTGPPGSAKTATVKEFTKELDEMIKKAKPGAKGCQLYTMRLTQNEITDFKGVPVYEKRDDQVQCSFAAPSVLPLKGSPGSADGYEMTVIFFDEMQQAIPQLQQLAGALLDGTVGDQELDHTRCFFVACANRVKDNATVFPLAANLSNRFLHGTMESDVDQWLQWALQNKINSVISGFLAHNSLRFNEPVPPASTENTPFATSRTWSKLSQSLNYIDKISGDSWINYPDQNLIRNWVLSTVGYVAGTDLLATAKNIKESIDVNAIEEGKNPKLPVKPDVQFAVIYELICRTDSYLAPVKQVDDFSNISAIQAALKNIQDKELKKIKNIILWLANKTAEKGDQKLNESLTAIYRGAYTDKKIKAALQVLGQTDKDIKLSLDLQKEINQKLTVIN